MSAFSRVAAASAIGSIGLPEGDDDAALVARAATGDRLAEEDLYRRHAPAVYGLALRLLRSRDEAMDVLQDTFVAAYEGLGELRDHAAFHAWIRSVAVHQVHRRFRRRKLLALFGFRRHDDDVALDALADTAASPEARAELRLLDGALRAVGSEERLAWTLRAIEGMKLEEVAVACKCSLATAKRRIAAADAAVRRHFDTPHGEPGEAK